MFGLRDTQRHFTNYVLREMGKAQASTGIKANGLSAEQRIAIYRNNTQLGLTEALKDGYPVINRLVGAEFFNHLAKHYIQRYPPKAGCLLSFGGQFADFIADFQPAEGLPYLADTAKLEWLWHEAFHEADATGLAVAELVQVDPALYDRLGLSLHPTARLMDSDYPILRIWQLNQSEDLADELINLEEGGCRLLICRPGLEVEIIALPDAEYQFLNLLNAGLSLSKAVEVVTLNDTGFDMSSCLQRWFNYGLFVGLTSDE
jgi:hypothetical protein